MVLVAHPWRLVIRDILSCCLAVVIRVMEKGTDNRVFRTCNFCFRDQHQLGRVSLVS